MKKKTWHNVDKGVGDSYIFILDNVRSEIFEEYEVYGQKVRSQKEMESMFKEAGLEIKDQIGPTELHKS